MKKSKLTIYKGFSLIEILVVISIFAVLGILSTRSIFLTLRGAKKSDSLVRVRENVNFAMNVIERQIRNAESVDCASSTNSILNYVASDRIPSSFSYYDAEDYIASGSGRLTSSDISITSCVFTCTQTDANTPPSIKVSIVAEDNTSTSIEKGTVTSETEIIARNY